MKIREANFLSEKLDEIRNNCIHKEWNFCVIPYKLPNNFQIRISGNIYSGSVTDIIDLLDLNKPIPKYYVNIFLRKNYLSIE